MTTQRSIATVLSLLADNTAGDISPEDIRDAAETFRNRFGGLYVSSSATTTISAVNTPAKVAGTTALIATDGGFSMPANNRLTYLDPADVYALALVSMSITAASSNQVISHTIALNGTPVASTEVQRKVGTSSDVGHVGDFGFFTLTTNDYLEVWVENTTSDADITAEFLNFGVITFPK